MTIDNQRLLQYALYGLGIVVWFVVWRFLGAMIGVVSLAFGLPSVEIPVFGPLSNLAALVALGITVAAVEYARRHEVVNKFSVEVISELRKVSWPSWKDVRGTTLVVLGVTLAVAFILWGFDSIEDWIIRIIFGLV